MASLNDELNKHSVADFERTAGKDTSTVPTKNFDDAQEKAAIAAAAKAARNARKSK